MEIITKEEIINIQAKWGEGIVDIGKKYLNNQDYESRAIDHINELYAYQIGKVLFKPSKSIKFRY